MGKKDYYEVLGVSKQADANQIKDAFRDLAMRFHPDRNKTPGAEEKFKEIAEAYAILSDPEKRRQYDFKGFEGISDISSDDLFSGINFDEIFRDFSIPLFERFFAGPRYAHKRAEDVEMLLEVPLTKVMTGGTENIKLARTELCESCKGSGAALGSSIQICDECQGRGKVFETRSSHNVVSQKIKNCTKCQGKGKIFERPCTACDGSGRVNKEKNIEVVIPPGVEDGTVLKISGQGSSNLKTGIKPGNLLIVIQTAKDPKFQRSGADLVYSASIPIYDAVLGTKIRVPTLTEDVIVKVPSGTRPQTSLRVKGRGLPRFQDSGYGDLYVLIDVQIPEHLKAQEKHLFEELRSVASDKENIRPSWFTRLKNNHDRLK